MRHIHTRSRFAWAVLGLTAVAALTLPPNVQGELLDDFNDGDDVGWTRFTLPSDLPGADWDASTFVYRLSVKGSLPLGGIVASFLDISSDGSLSNGYWRATVVRETENSTSHVFMRGEFAAKNAYAFGWYPDWGLCIQRFEGGAGDVLAYDDTFVQEVGTEYVLEAGAFAAESGASDLELRMWPVGDTRPVVAQLATTDSAYPSGANGLAAQAAADGDLSVTFDNVCFVSERIPGDLNCDGCVDQADLGILLGDWNCTGGDCAGDIDGNGDTDQADLGILLANWGEGCQQVLQHRRVWP